MSAVPAFTRDFWRSSRPISLIGSGALGGKASGLAAMQEAIAGHPALQDASGVSVSIPTMAVLGADVFADFMERNRLEERVLAGDPDDDRVARAFQRAELPPLVVGDLRALIASVTTPLAVRSSSLLEDALGRPLAGVYLTKMIPNHRHDADSRFRSLVEAVKLVYASTFFRSARLARRMLGPAGEGERMAVIIQEVVGRRWGTRFYPHLSGVARSLNFYPTGHGRREDGVVDLALGLGKTIVDGGAVWSYSPAFPKSPPPYNSIADLLKATQTEFWAVHMGPPPDYDPLRESEHLVRAGLVDAEADESLTFLASTYDPQSNRLLPGTGRRGPRALTFAPLLSLGRVPLNDALVRLLEVCRETLGAPVEVEFAATLHPRDGVPARLGFLQVRPLVAGGAEVEVPETAPGDPRVLLAAERVLGHGADDTIRDVVLVRPESFDPHRTPDIAREVAVLNERLLAQGRPYLLVGFGRWGTSDHWGGIPVTWGEICGARAIVEASLPAMRAELSQGSHFFHNVTSFRVFYFSLPESRRQDLDWEWLAVQPAESESELVRHLRLAAPLAVRVDGRSGNGVLLKP